MKRKKSNKNDDLFKKKKNPFVVIASFLVYELIFTACTFPFILLYGPFENAKKTYVGSAMGTMSHQYLATWFLSEEKINEIIGTSNEEESEPSTTNSDEIEIPVNKDDTITAMKLDGGLKYNGYCLIIKDPTRVKVGTSSHLGEKGETTSQIAMNNDAVAAINGGAFLDETTAKWTGTGAVPDGMIISNGEVLLDKILPTNPPVSFGLTEKGELIIGNYTTAQFLELGVKEALSFGPILLSGGKKVPIKVDNGISSRSAIGQTKDGSIVLVAIDGRGAGASIGASYEELQQVLLNLNVHNAVNLDGGRSTTLYYNGDVINTPSNSMGERTIPTAIIVK